MCQDYMHFLLLMYILQNIPDEARWLRCHWHYDLASTMCSENSNEVELEKAASMAVAETHMTSIEMDAKRGG